MTFRSVETSSGSPYLLSLGLSKEILAFVWIAGPLSGVLVQPYVGAKSDRCTSKFGRRRPFMVGGAIATVISLLAVAWAKEIVGGFATIFGFRAAEGNINLATIVFAVTMIYVLDFAINTVQAGIRAFIVDNAPTAQQDTANAWMTRLSGVGNILGFLFGFMDLPKTFDIFGATQFKDLCMLSSLALTGTLTLSCISIDEPSAGQEIRVQPPPRFARRRADNSDRSLDDDHSQGLFTSFKDIYRSIRHLPQQIRAVCYVQFFAWIGWFPFLFYITTYIGEIYASPRFAANPDMTDEEIDEVWQEGTRIATGALFIFAITSFVASVVLPILVARTGESPNAYSI
jgi:solute carrier family 45 protein 1/2/4